MRRVTYSILVSIALALLVGIGSYSCHVDPVLLKPIVVSAIAIGIIMNLMFFFIRRWDGCIEKLGGATFTLFLMLAVAVSLFSVIDFLPPPQANLVGTFTMIVCLQAIFVGWIATHFLRTSHFKPLKPGEAWRW